MKANPKGIPAQSPGLRGTSYPGNSRATGHLPRRGCGLGWRTRAQPLWGWPSGATSPRVARSSQPWAGGCNPLGIEVVSVSSLAGSLLVAVMALLVSPCFAADCIILPAPTNASDNLDTNNIHLIDLPTVLRLAGAQNLDVQIAVQKLAEARANRESALWQF